MACRLVDGKYPNYQAVIPQNNPNKLVVDRQLLLNSARRISLFSNKSTNLIRLKITGSELGLSAEDYDFNNAANERLTCNYSGEDMEIGFNSKFLVEMLQNLDTENVILELSAPNRAGILLPDSPDAKTEDVLMLVMPIMLNT
jgi:DNA polymerase-3 subunit beta